MVTSKSPLEIVCDAGPLIHLDELNCLDLLADFQAILVPAQVWEEVEHHLKRYSPYCTVCRHNLLFTSAPIFCRRSQHNCRTKWADEEVKHSSFLSAHGNSLESNSVTMNKGLPKTGW